MNDSYCVIAFGSTHAAIRVQKLLSDKGFSIIMMPTLRVITAGCGLSIRFSSEDLTNIQKAVSEANIEPSLHQFYTVENNMGEYKISKLEG